MNLILGVDGGHTKTVALVCACDGRVIGAGRAGSADASGAPFGDPPGAVGRAVQAALADAGVSRDRLAHRVFSLAGATSPDTVARLRRALLGPDADSPPTVVNDAIAALRAACPGGTGIVLVAGTGMGIAARAPSGESWFSGDLPISGGGGWLGQAALSAVHRFSEGTGSSTSLTGRLQTACGAASVGQMFRRIRSSVALADPPLAPTLAPLVLDEAERGDAVAVSIIEDASRQVADLAAMAAAAVGLGRQPFAIALAGGVFRHGSPLYPRTLEAALARTLPGNPVIRSPFEPVAGAAMLALEAAGVEVTPAVMDRMAATMPPPSLFDTSNTETLPGR